MVMVMKMVFRIKKNVVAIIMVAIICISTIFVKGAVKKSFQESIGVKLPIIMYHQLNKNGENLGRYVLSTEQLENDLIYIKNNGYKTVTVEDIIRYVNGEKRLSEKCIMLTFDDGYETAETQLYPLLKKYKMKAVISVVGAYTDTYTQNQDHNDTYSYLNWEQIKELNKTDEIEVQNHSYNMHQTGAEKRDGIKQFSWENFDDYFSALNNDIGKMQTMLMKKCDFKPTCMVYPFGSYGENTVSVCRKLGFLCTMTCEERINTLFMYRSESLFNLGRYNRPTGPSSEEFFNSVLGENDL